MLNAYIAVCCAMSFIALLLFGIDKRRAKGGKDRIPELTLLSFAALGGGLGAFLGMQLFRHKTNIRRKAHFVLSVPLCVLSQAALLLMLVFEGTV